MSDLDETLLAVFKNNLPTENGLYNIKTAVAELKQAFKDAGYVHIPTANKDKDGFIVVNGTEKVKYFDGTIVLPTREPENVEVSIGTDDSQNLTLEHVEPRQYDQYGNLKINGQEWYDRCATEIDSLFCFDALPKGTLQRSEAWDMAIKAAKKAAGIE